MEGGDEDACGIGLREGIRVGGGRPTTGFRGIPTPSLARPAAHADFPMAFIERRYMHTRLGGGVDAWKATCGT